MCETDRQRWDEFPPEGRLPRPSRPTLNTRTGLEVERDTRAFVQSSPRSLAGLTCRWQVPQTCSSPTATAATAREMRLKEALRHLGRQVLDCIFQSFSGEAILVRLDETDDAAHI